MRQMPQRRRITQAGITQDAAKEVNQKVAMQGDFSGLFDRAGFDGLLPIAQRGAFLRQIRNLRHIGNCHAQQFAIENRHKNLPN